MAKTPTKKPIQTTSKKAAAQTTAKTSIQKSVQKPIEALTKPIVKALAKTSAKLAASTASSPAKSAQSSAQNSVTTARAAAPESTLLGLTMKTWVSGARAPKGNDVRSGKRAYVFAFGSRDQKELKRIGSEHLARWQQQMLLESEADSIFFQGANGPLWILRAPVPSQVPQSEASLEKSSYARFRDGIGPIVNAMTPYKVDKLIVESVGLGRDEEMGLLVGLEIASYFFQENVGLEKKPRRSFPQILFRSSLASSGANSNAVTSAANLGLAVNVARHLTNLPPNVLNPKTYSEAIEGLFSGSRTVEIEIWKGEKLKQERMNLLLAVGQAAAEGPRLVHLRYRPDGDPAGLKPIALVGKGITFDSGGLDIKPASGMRWMKKDMGGSAAVIALAKWAELSGLQHPVDFYVSLAENAISGNAFRPGDVIQARSGMTVEIQNTDAEGRLVLADALDVAVTQEGADTPSAIINIATLTGANKVALGAEIAGLYSNDDELSERVLDASLTRGDLAWRIPLYQPYRASLKSSFADCQNSADGFGGAITAALFLESFVKKIPFAHLDIFAWKDGASGAWSEAGGSGQTVQALSELLSRSEAAETAQELA